MVRSWPQATSGARAEWRAPRTRPTSFITQKMLAVGIQSMATVEDAGTRPHVPVGVHFIPQLVSARALVLRQPPRLGTERLYGPLPPPPDWRTAAADIRALRDLARSEDFVNDDDYKRKYGAAYEKWADLAEQEVDGATVDARTLPKAGTRGRRPQLKWRSILPERPPPPPEGLDERHTCWRNLANVTGELRRIVWAIDSAREDDETDIVHDIGIDHDIMQMEATLGALGAIRDQLKELGPVVNLGDDDATTIDDGEAAQRAARGEALVRLRALAGRIDIAIKNAITEMRAARVKVDIDASGIDEQLKEQAERVEEQLDRAAAAARNFHEKSWREWILANINSGARNAHRFLRLPEEWRPTTVVDPDGVVTAAPMEIIDGHATKYDRLWNGGGDAPTAAGGAKPWQSGGHSPLQRPSPQDLRDAARTFAADTAVAYDGFALRHYCWLSDDALEALADVIEITERTGELPQQLRTLAMPLLPKPRGVTGR